MNLSQSEIIALISILSDYVDKTPYSHRDPQADHLLWKLKREIEVEE